MRHILLILSLTIGLIIILACNKTMSQDIEQKHKLESDMVRSKISLPLELSKISKDDHFLLPQFVGRHKDNNSLLKDLPEKIRERWRPPYSPLQGISSDNKRDMYRENLPIWKRHLHRHRLEADELIYGGDQYRSEPKNAPNINTPYIVNAESVYVAWIKHYASGLIPFNDYAYAMAIDNSGNVYVTGRSNSAFTGYDYVTIKYNSSGVEQWVQMYNGPANTYDYATAIAVDALGNVYVTGYSEGSGTFYDYATIKYNSSGVEEWVQRYNGPANTYDFASSIAVDASGNVYVTGYSYGSGTYSDYVTIKYSSSGVEQWVQRYNGPANTYDYATAIAVDALGNVYVTGYSYGSGIYEDYATVKYNSSGSVQWVQRYNGPENGPDQATAIAVDASGNVYVTGWSVCLDTYTDYATIKYNSMGVELWVQKYNGPANYWDEATAIAVDASGNVYVTGYSYGSGTNSDYVTIKYSLSGVKQWVQRYNGPANSYDYASSIAVDASGNVYVTGYSYGSGTYVDYATIKYTSSGVEEWVQRYNGPGNIDDYATAIAVDASGNVYVTGYSEGSGTFYDYATIKYDSSGVEQWVQRYNGPGNSWDEATAIAVDALGNVYVTGSSGGSSWSVYTTIKYAKEPVLVNLLPKQYNLYQNYPNPFNSSTVIKYDLPEESNINISIFNILGQEVKTLVNEIKEAGYKSVEWNSTNDMGNVVSCGIYFYRIDATSISDPKKTFMQVKKMILLR